MKKYIGTKKINALPMGRLRYNEFRGWKLPEDEDGADEGYLVEYTDGGKPNTPEFDGYVSWSPKEQFDNAYKEISPENKVEYSQIQKMVASLDYKFERVGETTVTGCWAFLPNGFQVGYGDSACVDPANFDFDLGKKYAKERCLTNATNKLWELEGYLLKNTGSTSK
jgi:hypothetical protein